MIQLHHLFHVVYLDISYEKLTVLKPYQFDKKIYVIIKSVTINANRKHWFITRSLVYI